MLTVIAGADVNFSCTTAGMFLFVCWASEDPGFLCADHLVDKGKEIVVKEDTCFYFGFSITRSQ